jgi:hypothetical protein
MAPVPDDSPEASVWHLDAARGPSTPSFDIRWSRRGIWKRIFDALAAKSRDSLYLIDSTIVKAHRAASGAKGGKKNQAIGISRGGRTTKIHAVVDGKGRPLNFQRHWWTGPRQPGRRRSLEYASIAARGDRRQGL